MRLWPLFFFVCLPFFTGCSTVSHRVYHVGDTGTDAKKRGIYYALPRTVLVVKTDVERSNTVAGPYADLAEDLKIELPPTLKLPVHSAKKSVANIPHGDPGSDNYKKEYESAMDAALKAIEIITFSYDVPIEITTLSEPDPQHVYLVEFSGNAMKDRSMFLALGKDGIIQKGDFTETDKTLSIASEIFKATSSLASSVLKLEAMVEDDKKKFVTSREKRALQNAEKIRLNLRNIAALEKVEMQESTPAAVALLDSAKKTIDRLKKENQQLLEGFYVDKTNTASIICRVTPDESYCDPDQVTKQLAILPLLFLKFDPKIGFALPSSVKGFIPEEMRQIGSSPTFRDLALKIEPEREVLERLKSDVAVKESRAKEDDKGLRYRIPASVEISVFDGKDEVIQAKVATQITQLGTVASIPVRVPGSKSQYVVNFHSDLGSISDIKLDTTAIDPAPLGTIAESSGTLLDTIKARRTPNSGAVKLQAERDELALRAEILELRCKLGLKPPKGMKCPEPKAE